MLSKYRTLTEVLAQSHAPESYLGTLDAAGVERYLPYQDLLRQALRLLHGLQERGVSMGDEVVIQLDDPQTFARAFWACLLGRFTAIPLNTASNLYRAQKLFNVWKQLRTPRLLTDATHVDRLRKAVGGSPLDPDLSSITSQAILVRDLEASEDVPEGTIHEAAPDDIAFVQFSSGSTGTPKGVILTHRNLLTTMDAMYRACRIEDIGEGSVSWLPLTHDMGLVGFHLTPVAIGARQFIIASELFARQPETWLRKLTDERAPVTGSPNFGYRHILRWSRPERLRGIDLSALRLIVNGAEPISAGLCTEFLQRMECFGLDRNVMMPAYGLAEASLIVTAAGPGCGIDTVDVSRRQLRLGRRLKPPELLTDTLRLVDLGDPVTNVSLRIVDEDGRLLDDDRLGHVQIRGDSVTPGYYCNARLTAKTFTTDGWLKTGDIGFLHNQRLVLVGRAKDVIFANGQNFYAHDVEWRIADQVGIDCSKVVVCSVLVADDRVEEVIAFILFRDSIEEFLPLAQAVKRIASREIGCPIDHVVPLRSLPTTTSGKKERYRLREAYLKGEHDDLLRRIKEASVDDISERWKNDIEARVAAVCQRALPLKSIGRHDDLFSLGLDSPGAIRLLAGLAAEFGIGLKPDTVQICPTVAALAHRIATIRGPKGPRIKPATPDKQKTPATIEPRDHIPIRKLTSWTARGQRKLIDSFHHASLLEAFPVGPMQQRHLRRRLIAPQAFQIDIGEQIREHRLHVALRTFINSQALLRSTLQENGSLARFQIYRLHKEIDLPTMDISQYSQRAQKEAIRQILRQLVFDLDTGPRFDRLPYRLLSLKRSEFDFTVLFVINHVFSDRESGRILEYHIDRHLRGEEVQGDLSYRHFLKHVVEPSIPLVQNFWGSSLCRSFRAAVDHLREGYREPSTAVAVSPISLRFDYTFPGPERHEDHHVPANYALHIFLRIAQALFNVGCVPVKVAINRRTYGAYNYRNTVGEFHDNVIFSIEKGDLSLKNCHHKLRDALRFMDEHGYRLMSFKDCRLLRESVGEAPLSFNYLGNVSYEEDERIMERLRPFPHALFPCLAYSIENERIRILLNNGLQPRQAAVVTTVFADLGESFELTQLRGRERNA